MSHSIPYRARRLGAALAVAVASTAFTAGADNLPAGDAIAATGGQARAVFQACNDRIGCELWITDGTRAGTALLRRIGRGERDSRPGAFADLGDGRVAFNANPPFAPSGFPRVPYITDGTREGTGLVRRMPGSHSVPSLFTALGDGRYVFRTNLYRDRWMRAIWVSDGTREGTEVIRVFANQSVHRPESFTRLRAGEVLFTMDDGNRGRELWITDGTADGTVMVRNLTGDATGSLPSGLTRIAEGQVVFSADDGENGRQLWVTDGTRRGTQPLTSTPDGGAEPQPREITAIGDGRALFTTDDDELWITDGTAGGTVMLADVTAPRRPLDARDFTPLGDGSVVFTARTEPQTFQLWVTDGTAAGTRIIRQAEPLYRAEHLRALGDGRVVFWQFQQFRNHYALWISDGTRPGTREVRQFPNLRWIDAGSLADTTSMGNGLALFAYDNGRTGREPWVTDGTRQGTGLLRNINRTGASNPIEFMAFVPAGD